MACFMCGGSAHPSTGCAYGERVIVCGPCVRRFWSWFRQQQHKKWSGCSFYDAVERSVRARDE